jgi:hypothetical protein
MRWLIRTCFVVTIFCCTPRSAGGQDRNVDDLRKEQEYLRQAMRDNIDASKFLVTTFAYFLAALVILQALREWVFQRRQREREDELEARHIKREDDLEVGRREYERHLRELWVSRDDRIERHRVLREVRVDTLAQNSTRSISSILNVLHRTLEARRAAEEQARRAESTSEARIKDLTSTIQRFTEEIAGLKMVAAEVRRTKENEQASIEETALRLSLSPRHQFRHRLRAFEHFTQQYELFCSRYASPDGDPFLGFTPAVSYVRGIAAHYANDPMTATTHLTRVVEEVDDVGQRKRFIVAFYLLGLTESNFECYEKADEYFKNALGLEEKPPDGERLMNIPPDLLTRVVAAEAAATRGDPVLSIRYLEDIEKALIKIGQECELANIELPTSLRRLGDRATLVRVNLKVCAGSVEYSGAIKLLEEMTRIPDHTEYYARVTLAQLLSTTRADDNLATQTFKDAYTAIQMLGHLVPENITEIRSRVLLLMTAALAARWGLHDKAMAEEHLNEAAALAQQLPKRSSQTCSVFSTLSKRNESARNIVSHIDLIRKGTILL